MEVWTLSHRGLSSFTQRKKTFNVKRKVRICCQNHFGFWGSAPNPTGGAYNAPPRNLVVRGFFLPFAIAASHLRRLQFAPQTLLPDLNFFPPGLPYSIPGSATVYCLCGAHEL